MDPIAIVDKIECVFFIVLGPPRCYYDIDRESEKWQHIMIDNESDRFFEGVYSTYQNCVSRMESIAKRLNCGGCGKWIKPHEYMDVYRNECLYREIWIGTVKYNNMSLNEVTDIIKDQDKLKPLNSGKKVYILIEDYKRLYEYDEDEEGYLAQFRIYKPKGTGTRIIGIYTQLAIARKMALEKRKDEGSKKLWKKVGQDDWIYNMEKEIYIIERVVDMS